MEHLPLLCRYFIYNWVLFAQKYTVLLSTLQRNVSTGRKKARWRKSKLKCRHRNKEASSSQLLQLPDHGPQPTHCDQVPHWQKKLLQASIKKLFNKLDHENNALYELELPKAQIENKEPIIVGFFILQYAKLRMLELCYNFFTRFCDKNKIEELNMGTDFEKELEDCIRSGRRAEWQSLRSIDCVDSFTAGSVANFFPEHVV